MKSRAWHRWITLLAALMMAGCARTTPIRYKMDARPLRPTPHVQRLLVAVFEDARPSTERTQKAADFGQRDLETSDKDFKPEVTRQIATALAEHLTQAQVAQTCLVEDVPADLASHPEALNALAAKEIDVVLTGRLTHFRGFLHGMMPGAMLFGLAGVLVETVANPKYVGGHVAYSPLTVIDVKRQRILWQGEVGHQFDDKQTLYKGHVAYALDALKEANAKVAQIVDHALTSRQRELTMNQHPPE
jgi:hypothetical protein